MERAKEIFESKPVQLLLVGYSFCSAIMSIYGATNAYSQLDSATTEFLGIIQYWERPPYRDVLIQSTSTCPAGYSLLATPSWPGTTSSACACSSTAYSTREATSQLSSDAYVCDENQTQAGCVTQPSISAVPLGQWRGSYICTKRSSEPQLISASKERPIPTKAGSCEKGYTACGTGTYEKSRSTCVKNGETCPITGALMSGTTPIGYSAFTAAADGKSLYTRSAYDGEMPINELIVALYTEGGRRGDCYGTGASQKRYGDPGTSYGYINDYPRACLKSDTRWGVVDSQLEAEYLLDNFADTTNCTSAVSNYDKDYIATGIKCSATTAIQDTNCMVHGLGAASVTDSGIQNAAWSGDCAASDTVCLGIMYQSKCGALNRWASQASSYSWALLARHEAYWLPTCEVSKFDIKKVEKPINTIRGLLLMNVVFCVIANLFTGMFFPISLFMNKFYGNVSQPVDLINNSPRSPLPLV